jgi:hypothetical protein
MEKLKNSKFEKLSNNQLAAFYGGTSYCQCTVNTGGGGFVSGDREVSTYDDLDKLLFRCTYLSTYNNW